MFNNDVLRSLRYTLDLSDRQVVALAADGGEVITREQLDCYLLAENEAQCLRCPDPVLAAFLNGLIRHRRGARRARAPVEKKIDNNLILKKLRIAFALRDDDILELVREAGSSLSRAELNAVFQKPEHKNFRVCGDQLLRQFLLALGRKHRPSSGAQRS